MVCRNVVEQRPLLKIVIFGLGVLNSSSCALVIAVFDELDFLANIIPGSKPIATNSRRFSLGIHPQ